MKLFASIATTALITGSIWGLVLAQPAVAEDASGAKSSATPVVDNKSQQLFARRHSDHRITRRAKLMG